MATPQQLREETAVVVEMAVSDFRTFASDLSDTAIRAALFDLLPGLVVTMRETAATIAAEWYDEFRLERGIPGTYEALVPDLRDPGVEQLIGWAENESRNLLGQLDLIEGGLRRRVANGSRETIMDNASSDPNSIGHQRYARSSGGCEFCQLLASRGAVYRSRESATFGAHDSCQCVAIPAFGNGAPLPVQPYTPSARNISDADRARVRDYLRNH